MKYFSSKCSTDLHLYLIHVCTFYSKWPIKIVYHMHVRKKKVTPMTLTYIYPKYKKKNDIIPKSTHTHKLMMSQKHRMTSSKDGLSILFIDLCKTQLLKCYIMQQRMQKRKKMKRNDNTNLIAHPVQTTLPKGTC